MGLAPVRFGTHLLLPVRKIDPEFVQVPRSIPAHLRPGNAFVRSVEKDEKDGDSTPRMSSSTISSLKQPPTASPAGLVRLPVNPREIGAFFHDESSSSDDLTVSSSSATADIALSTPRPINCPTSTSLPPSSTSSPSPDSDEDEEMSDLYLPPLIAPATSLLIPNILLRTGVDKF